MRNDNKRLRGKLYGIGIGPGDPKLLTLKAKEILNRVDAIFVPKGSDDGISCACSIIESEVLKKKSFIDLTFPMTKNKKVLKAYWRKAGQRIIREIEMGRQVAFVTLGDPLIYSTYIYLLKMLTRDYPSLDIETVPGISSFSAAAAACAFPLVQGNERLAILPVRKDLTGLKQAFKEFDTVVLMKVGSKLDRVIGLLKETGLLKSSILISRLGHPGERIVYNLASLKDKRLGYLSVILVKSKKS